MGLSYVVDPTTNKTYFTYFSEFEKTWENSHILSVTVLVVLFVVSLAGNLLVILFFVRFKAIRHVTNLFITNLAVSDLIFSIMVPLVMTTRVTGEWIFGEVLCHMMIAFEFVSGIVSVWTMVLISVDRYQAIVKLKTRRRSTLRGTVIRLGLVWLGALLYTSPIATFFTTVRSTIEEESGSRTVTICTLDFPGPDYIPLVYSCINIFVVFIIPLTIISSNYKAIMQKFSSSLQRMRNHMESAPRSHDSSVRASANMQKEARVMRMLVAVVSIFLLMWGPVTFFILALTADYTNRVIQSYQLTAVFTITYANAAVNPVMYGILNEQYRSRFRRLFSQAACKEFVTQNTSVHDSVGRGSRNGVQVVRTLSGRELNRRLELSDRDGSPINGIDNICQETMHRIMNPADPDPILA